MTMTEQRIAHLRRDIEALRLDIADFEGRIAGRQRRDPSSHVDAYLRLARQAFDAKRAELRDLKARVTKA